MDCTNLTGYLVVFLLLIIVLGPYIRRRFKYGGLPPGPLGLPYLGSLPFLGKNVSATLRDLKEKYGNVLTIYLGNQPVVVLNDWDSIKEALVRNGNAFSGRPSFLLTNLIHRNKDIVFSEGPEYKTRRRISLTILRDFGMGKSSLENHIVEEGRTLMKFFRSREGRPVTIAKRFSITFLNILLYMVSGKRYSNEDREMRSILEDVDSLVDSTASASVVNIFEFLKYLPRFSPDRALKCSNSVLKRSVGFIKSHINNFDPNDIRDFIDDYLSRTLFNDQSGQLSSKFDEEELAMIIRQFMFAGIETTDTTLTWGLLYLVSYPNVQTEVHREIDRVIGDRTPTYADRFSVPYTMSVISEFSRLASILSLSVPYKTTKNINFRGYSIPGGVQVWTNIWAVHHDPELWGDPHNFRPERFLNDSGQFEEPEYLIPFGIGLRQCLGESLARMQMFLIFVMLFQSFKITLPENSEPSFERTGGIVTRPKQLYKVIFKSRKGN